MNRDQRRSVDPSRSTPELNPDPQAHFSGIVFWAAAGENHPCAKDEPKPVGGAGGRRFSYNLAEVLTRDLEDKRLESIKRVHGLSFRQGRFSFPIRLCS